MIEMANDTEHGLAAMAFTSDAAFNGTGEV